MIRHFTLFCFLLACAPLQVARAEFDKVAVTPEYLKAHRDRVRIEATYDQKVAQFEFRWRLDKPQHVTTRLVIESEGEEQEIFKTAAVISEKETKLRFSMPMASLAHATLQLGVGGYDLKDGVATPWLGGTMYVIRLQDVEAGSGTLHREPEGPVRVYSLAKAVEEFNVRARGDAIGKTQPPLTEEEVVAALRGTVSQLLPGAPDDMYDRLHSIAESATLPEGAELGFSTSWNGYRGFKFQVWRIDLSLMLERMKSESEKPEPHRYVFTIRDQKISSQKLAPGEEHMMYGMGARESLGNAGAASVTISRVRAFVRVPMAAKADDVAKLATRLSRMGVDTTQIDHSHVPDGVLDLTCPEDCSKDDRDRLVRAFRTVLDGIPGKWSVHAVSAKTTKSPE